MCIRDSWYPSDQLRLMSGYSGACQFFYSELADFFLTGEDELPVQIGAVQAPLSQQEAREAIEDAVAAGKLPPVSYTHLDVYKRQGRLRQ